MKAKATVINLLLATTSLVLMLLGAETGLRVLISRFNPFEPDLQLGYRLKSGFDGLYPRTVVRTDAAGHRIPAGVRQPASGKLLFLGDSVTFGFGVPAEDSFPFVLGDRLERNGDITNAAAPGYNLGQIVGILREQLARRRPEIIVYGLCLNDIGSAATRLEYNDIDPHRSRREHGSLLSRSLLLAFVERRLGRLAEALAIGTEESSSRASFLRDFPSQELRGAAEAFDRQWTELEQIQERSQIPLLGSLRPAAGAKRSDPLQRYQQHAL